MVNFSKGKGYSKKDIVESGTPFMRYGNLYTDFEIEITDIKETVEEKPKSVKSKGGEILVPSSGETPSEIARASTLLKKDVIIGGDINILTVKNNNVLPTFLALDLNTNRNSKELSKYAVGNSVVHIYNKDLHRLKIYLPDIETQKKIIRIWRTLDKLLTLHNKKLKFLKKLENAYSVCLFAFKSNAPLVRFSNFNNDWEMFKVKDLFTVTRGQVLSVDKISKFKTDNNKFPVYSSQTHNNGLLGYYHDFLFDTAITWTTDGANAGTVKFRSGKFYSTNVNGVLISDDGYACEAVAKIIEKETPRWVVRVGNPKLMNNVMSDITIKISSDVNELEKISNIFVKINTLIELEKDIIEKYENLKKEYLNYLFI